MRRSRIRLILLLAVLETILGIVPGIAQESIEMSAECEASVRELVDRYEEVRVLLREQIALNTELYSEEEMATMTADLRTEIVTLGERIDTLSRQLKNALGAAKIAEQESLAYKSQLIKERTALSEEIVTLEAVVDSIEEERLFTIGAGFSRDGYVGGLGMFNLPGTNLSAYGEANYQFRTQESFISMGVAFQFLPQRRLVENWERFRRRIINRRSRTKADAETGATAERSVGDVLGDTLEQEQEPEESRSERRRGAVEDTVPLIP